MSMVRSIDSYTQLRQLRDGEERRFRPELAARAGVLGRRRDAGEAFTMARDKFRATEAAAQEDSAAVNGIEAARAEYEAAKAVYEEACRQAAQAQDPEFKAAWRVYRSYDNRCKLYDILGSDDGSDDDEVEAGEADGTTRATTPTRPPFTVWEVMEILNTPHYVLDEDSVGPEFDRLIEAALARTGPGPGPAAGAERADIRIYARRFGARRDSIAVRVFPRASGGLSLEPEDGREMSEEHGATTIDRLEGHEGIIEPENEAVEAMAETACTSAPLGAGAEGDGFGLIEGCRAPDSIESVFMAPRTPGSRAEGDGFEFLEGCRALDSIEPVNMARKDKRKRSRDQRADDGSRAGRPPTRTRIGARYAVGQADVDAARTAEEGAASFFEEPASASVRLGHDLPVKAEDTGEMSDVPVKPEETAAPTNVRVGGDVARTEPEGVEPVPASVPAGAVAAEGDAAHALLLLRDAGAFNAPTSVEDGNEDAVDEFISCYIGHPGHLA